jgi:hypothetical protein
MRRVGKPKSDPRKLCDHVDKRSLTRRERIEKAQSKAGKMFPLLVKDNYLKTVGFFTWFKIPTRRRRVTRNINKNSN